LVGQSSAFEELVLVRVSQSDTLVGNAARPSRFKHPCTNTYRKKIDSAPRTCVQIGNFYMHRLFIPKESSSPPENFLAWSIFFGALKPSRGTEYISEIPASQRGYLKMVPVEIVRLEFQITKTIEELSSEADEVLNGASAYSTTTGHCHHGKVPFKFMISRRMPSATQRYARFPRAMSNFCVKLQEFDDTSRASLLSLFKNKLKLSDVADSLSKRPPFLQISNFDTATAMARAVFSMLIASDDGHANVAISEAVAFFFTISTSSSIHSNDIFPENLLPFEYYFFRRRTPAPVDDDASAVPATVASPLRSKRFVSSLRNLLEASTCALSDFTIPCDDVIIRTSGYEPFLGAVHASIQKFVSVDLGGSNPDVYAIALASLSDSSLVDDDSSLSFLRQLTRARAFEEPSCTTAFIWTGAVSCFHAMDEASVDSTANDTVRLLTTAENDRRIKASLYRLAILAISSRTKQGFLFASSNKSIFDAACSIGVNGGPSCLDLYSNSPSGLLQLPNGVHDDLLRKIGLSFCAHPSNEIEGDRNAKLQSLRRFVSIDRNLFRDSSTLEMVNYLNIELEQCLEFTDGPLRLGTDTVVDAAHSGAVAATFRLKTIAAVREACRFRISSQTNYKIVMVAWISKNSSFSDNRTVLFARTFFNCLDIDAHTATFDFEDDLRRALRSNTSCEGAHGRLSRHPFEFPVLDAQTEEALQNSRCHGVVCSRIHTPLNGHIAVSVVSIAS